MKRLFLAIAALIVMFSFQSCEEDENNDYFVSDSLKEFIDYGNETVWIYDVYDANELHLKVNYFISDTIVKGAYSEFYNKTITSPLTERHLILDTTFAFADSVYLFGEYRVFKKDIYIRDTIALSNLKVYDPSYDDEDLNNPDTALFERYYSVYDTIPPRHYTDTMFVSGTEKGKIELSMRNRASTEEFQRVFIESKLDNDIRYIEYISAASNGYEYYRRDNERLNSYTNTLDLTFDTNGSLVESLFDPEDGVASYEEIGTVELNGKSYDNVVKILTHYTTRTIDNNNIVNNVEYWYVKGFGMLKMENKTTNITWTLK